MKKVEVVISPNVADRVIELLEEQSVSTFTICSILDRDSSGSRPRTYRGRSYTAAMVSKIKVEAVVPDNRASEIAHAIMDSAQGPGCSCGPRAIILSVGEISTESSSKTPRPSVHHRLHPAPTSQRPIAAADPASAPAPLHLARWVTSLLTALLGPGAADSKTPATPTERSSPVARVAVLGPPEQLGLRPR